MFEVEKALNVKRSRFSIGETPLVDYVELLLFVSLPLPFLPYSF